MNGKKRASNARSALLDWHKIHGRHSLPWRREFNPYAVLVSEFMLQQTTVASVEPRFIEWMKLFPTLTDLAMATESEVLTAWQGLGYYSRARRLHSSARAIVDLYEGIIPSSEKFLSALPGVGAYTAAAIRAFAYNEHALVVDTNIARVLARWDNLNDSIDSSAGKKSLGRIAASFYTTAGCRAVATALMDLGAALCTSAKPRCEICPLKKTCLAPQPEELPQKSPRPLISKRSEIRACFFHDNRLYLEKSSGPHWHGLWILPELEEIKANGRCITEIVYPITRYRVKMKIYPARENPPPHLSGFTTEELESIPIPSPHRRAIAKICKAIGMVKISDHTPNSDAHHTTRPHKPA